MPSPYSYLFVPGDAERKIDKAVNGDARAIILDLEDSVAPARRNEAVRIVRDFLSSICASQRDTAEIWVRLNAADPDMALAELSALPLERLTGVFHPKLAGHDQLERMGHWLDALETRDGLAAETIGIIGIITENANALVGELAASLARGHPRLRGYTWGLEDLSADLGRAPFAPAAAADQRIAESLQLRCLFMAAAAGVDAIDSISTAIHRSDALVEACDMARSLGYVAKMAIHPNQVGTINERFAPDPEAVAWAKRVDAVAVENPELGVFSLDGLMIDKPHLDVARRIVAQANCRD